MSLVCAICGDAAPLPPGLISLAAVGATWAAMLWLARRQRLGLGLSLLAGPVGLLAAFWFAHLYVVAERLPASGLQDAALLWQFWAGGKSVLGAFLGAGLAAGLLSVLTRRPVGRHLDAWVPAVALGYAVARLACFVNGDDFGTPSGLPWAVQFPEGTLAYAVHLERGWILPGAASSLPVHPAQLYHAAVGLLGFLLLLRWRPGWPGERVVVAMGWYGLTRLLIQFARDDHWSRGPDIDLAQLLSLGLIALAGLLWWWRRRRADVADARARRAEVTP